METTDRKRGIDSSGIDGQDFGLFPKPPTKKNRVKEPYSRRSASINPGPSYRLFERVDYVDSYGREYMIATKSEADNLLGELDGISGQSSLVSQQSLYSEETKGTCVMWIRIPIYLKNTVGYPDAQMNESLKLLNTSSYIEASARVGRCMHEPRRKSGYVVLSNFTTKGQTDPTDWKHLINREERVKHQKSHF